MSAPPTPDDVAAVRRLIHAHAQPGEEQDWLEALGLADYEARDYAPDSLSRNGTAGRTHTVTRTAP